MTVEGRNYEDDDDGDMIWVGGGGVLLTLLGELLGNRSGESAGLFISFRHFARWRMEKFN